MVMETNVAWKRALLTERLINASFDASSKLASLMVQLENVEVENSLKAIYYPEAKGDLDRLNIGDSTL